MNKGREVQIDFQRYEVFCYSEASTCHCTITLTPKRLVEGPTSLDNLLVRDGTIIELTHKSDGARGCNSNQYLTFNMMLKTGRESSLFANGGWSLTIQQSAVYTSAC